ncbi:DUF5027 family lipoprotein [Miniphocaeibacter massiliensis]|uniref:DUF5027 family lipoprotein n=1 Tax=Miniphocaeibacter massiliensis TaxID=2041841 RepID=UPI000C1C0638|nr:DUF5027 family lipoprotein [Miniphocaeibacter massiliensis]
MYNIKHIKLKDVIFFVLLISIITIFTGCSLKDVVMGNNTKEEIYEIGKSKVYKLGEEIEVKSPTKDGELTVGYKFKINSAKVYNTPEEAGIEKDKLVSSDYYGVKKEPVIKTIDEIAKGKTLLCDIDITNINEESENNITFLDLVLEKGDKELNSVGLPIYLSNSIAVSPEDSNQYHFKLEKGKSTNLQVAFPVDEEVLKSGKLYLADGFMGDEETVSYIDLGL